MFNFFEFDDYKPLIRARVRQMPKQGHGQWLKIAQFTGMHTTLVSQVFKGDLHLSLEQAQRLTRYFGMTELESEYFLDLVQWARSGTAELKAVFQGRLRKIRERAENLSDRLQYDIALDEKAQALFYSSWLYSGIRLLTSIPRFQNRDAIAAHFGIPISTVNRIVEFLLSADLCRETGDGKLVMGKARTYVGKDSPLIERLHVNWRLKAMQQFNRLSDDDLMFTNAVTLSKSDFKKVKEELIQLIEKFRTRVDQSPAEELACLNIDWISVR